MDRRLGWALAAALVLGAGGGGWWWTGQEIGRDAAARGALARYVEAWGARDLTGVAFAEKGAAADFAAAVEGLGPATVTAHGGDLRRDGATASASVTVTWTLPGETEWSYETPVRLVEREDQWVVSGPGGGSPWHPRLRPGQTLSLERTAATRGDLLDRDGAPLTPRGPTRVFGQPLLGAVGEVTAEMVRASEGRYVAGDRAGRSGLQGQYDGMLAGTPGLAVVTSGGQRLFGTEPVPGEDVRTTLDPGVQAAAERALADADLTVPGAVVAVEVPTGEVLAVANAPGTGFDRALTGRYPPGSTFKVATTYAFLTGGVTAPTAVVPCPPTATVDGRAFRNAGGESIAGRPTFAQDFAASCNTAFVSLAARLGSEDLSRAAAALGIGSGWAESLGVTGAFDGSVPATRGGTDAAAAAIGQGRVEVSPLALAVMSASIGRGTSLPPVLVRSGDGGPRPTPLDGRAVGQLRSLMADVVTSGSATVLRGTPGGTVRGKTGTAEHGRPGTPPYVWFTGYQEDIAFTVLVEAGRSGGAVAAPVAKDFLTALAALP